MKKPTRRTNNGKEEQSQPSYQIFKQGGHGSPKCKVLLLCLALLNVVLLISAIVVGMKCANFKQDSLDVSQLASPHLISELEHLRRNCSDVQLAEEEALGAIQKTEEKHGQLKVQLQQLESNKRDLQTQLESLRTENVALQANISSMEGSCGKCPADWFFHNSSCYFFSIVKSASFQKNWHDSRADCISRGSDLTVIDSPEEQKYLSAKGKSLLNGRPSTWENGFWVGLTDLEKEKKWVWINNVTEVESRYWSPGEPNNHGPDGEDCAVIVYKSTSPWKTRYDAKCQDHKLYWLCETHVQ